MSNRINVWNDPNNGFDFLGQYTLKEALHKLNDDVCKICSTGRGYRLCMQNSQNRHWSDKDIFEAWYELEIEDMSWRSGLPTCPCTLCFEEGEPVKPKSNTDVEWEKPGKINILSKKGHPGGTYEMRSHANSYGAGQQCVYDEDGVILNDTEDGPGTEDRKSPSLFIWEHTGNDVTPFYSAKSLDNGSLLGPHVQKYFNVRKMNTLKNCIGKK